MASKPFQDSVATMEAAELTRRLRADTAAVLHLENV